MDFDPYEHNGRILWLVISDAAWIVAAVTPKAGDSLRGCFIPEDVDMGDVDAFAQRVRGDRTPRVTH